MTKKIPTVLQIISRRQGNEAQKDTIECAMAVKDAGGRAIVVSSGGDKTRTDVMSGFIFDLQRHGIEHIKLPCEPSGFFGAFRLSLRLAKIIEKEKVDIIHARSRISAKSAKKAAIRKGIPFVTSFYGPYSLGMFGLKKFKNAVMTSGDTVFTPSEFIKNHITTVYDTPAEKIKVLPTGIDEGKFDMSKISVNRLIFQAQQWRIPDDEPVIVYPAPFIKNKGHLLMLKALSLMENRRLRCIFTGEDKTGKFIPFLLKKARALHVDSCVQFINEPVCSDTAYAIADVVVYTPERTEAFTHAILEAQAVNRPVIVSDNGGIGDCISNGVSGFICEAKNAEALAQTIEKALSLPQEKREKVIHKAQHFLQKKYACKTLRQATLRAYVSLMKKKREIT